MLDTDTREKLKHLSLLYVEDEKELQDTMQELLNKIFANVYTVSNGQEGLDFFNRLNPDMIITDILMPVMDGLQMVKSIRELDRAIPIIILSAYDDKQYLLDAIDNNITKYMVKPIIGSVFYDTLNKLLSTMELKIDFDFDLFYYPKEHKIQKNGEYLYLTASEDIILSYLLKYKNKVITQETLINLLDNATMDIIRTHIKNIRKKTKSSIIETIATVGYKLNINYNK